MVAHGDVNRSNSEALVTLLEKQAALCRRLEDLTASQRHLITGEDPQPLLALLAKRKTVVDELGSLNQELSTLHEWWRQNHQSADAALRRRVTQLLQLTGEALQGVLRADEQDAGVLAARKAQTAKQMGSLAGCQHALEAYGVAAGPTNRSLIGADESA